MKIDLKDHSPLIYREGVGIMLLNSHNKVFVGERINGIKNASHWQMPQGGIDRGETPLQAALRELKEEVGTNKVDVIASFDEWLSYDLPDYLIKDFWNGKFRGQKQIWFLMRIKSDDENININTEEPEFKNWKWVDPKALPLIIIDFKKELYENVLLKFFPLIK